MTPRAAGRLAKAEGFLAQLKSVSSTDAPAGAIHLAYYAMLHGASAVLLDRFGEAPKTHAGTIGGAAPTADEAESMRKAAIEFVAYCRSLL